MRGTDLAGLCSVLLLLAGCSTGAETDERLSATGSSAALGDVGVSARDSSQSPRVMYATEKLDSFDLLLAFSEEGTLRGADADLWSIAWMGVASDSSLLFAHSKQQQVFHLTGAGAPLQPLGRKGAGPGEFRRLKRAGWLRDTLWVSDFELRRVTAFTPAFDLAYTKQVAKVTVPKREDLPLFRSYADVTPLALLPDNEMLVEVAPSMNEALRSPSLLRRAILRVSREGEFKNLVAAVPVNERYLLIRTSTGGAAGANPFGWEPIWDVSATGRSVVKVEPVSGSESLFQVLSVSADSDTLFHRTFSLEPTRASRRESDSIWTALRGDVTVPEILAHYDSVDDQNAYPLVTGVRAASDGSTWINLSHFGEHKNPWLVLAANGATRGILNLPEGFKVAEASGPTVWISTVDSDGFFNVTRVRLTPVASTRQ